jgi:hypothetical protein
MGCCGEKRKALRAEQQRPPERQLKPSLTGGTLRGESAPAAPGGPRPRE